MGFNSWEPLVRCHRGINKVSGYETEGMSIMGRIKSNTGIRAPSDTPPTLMKRLQAMDNVNERTGRVREGLRGRLYDRVLLDPLTLRNDQTVHAQRVQTQRVLKQTVQPVHARQTETAI